MTKLLASVANLAEAQFALNASADLIDLKNPKVGVLGALSLTEIRQIVEFIAGQRPVSATIGDLPIELSKLSQTITQTADCGVDFVKIGFFGPISNDCLEVLSRHTEQGTSLIAVLLIYTNFYNYKVAFDLLPSLAAMGFRGVMLDTVNKQQGSLRDYLTDKQLGDFVRHARKLNLLSGLAGSLRLADIQPLCDLSPDYLGFRGALCQQQQRQAVLDPQAFATVVEAFHNQF